MSTPTPLDHTAIEELLGAYALDAVDRDTAAVIERHLEGCVRCAAEVAQHHEVAGLLANSGGAPSAQVWDGIAARLDGTSDDSWHRLAARLEIPASDTATRLAGPGGGAEVVPLDRARRRSRVAAAGAALVAAAAAVVALALGVQVHHLNGQVSALQAAPTVSGAERAAIAAPGTRRIPMADPARPGTSGPPASIILTAAGTGFVVNDRGHGLSALPSDRTYQLWGVVGGRTVSLGLLGPDPGIVPFSVAGSPPVSAFAITDEVAGGVVVTAHQPVAVGTVHL